MKPADALRRPLTVAVCALVVTLGGATNADPAADAGVDAVVVRVGQSEVRRSELAFLLLRLHEFERRSYGDTPDQVRRGFIEKRLIPELLLAEEGKRLKAGDKPQVRGKIQGALVDALKDDIERDIDHKLTRAELDAYCKSEGGQHDAGTCRGDPMGYRVALRRTRGSEELARLDEQLRKREVKQIDYALLGSLPVDPNTPAP
ncbi:MAG: hypothetical protein IPI67_38155 [Myxococcales bacterium]|nr:hypothetical protein [Myxococcales bacterium]